MILSKRAADAERAWKELKEKHEAGETIEAKVAEVVKGGLVDVGVRGFIPLLMWNATTSRISPGTWPHLPLKVLEIDPNKQAHPVPQAGSGRGTARKKRNLNNLQVGEIWRTFSASPISAPL